MLELVDGTTIVYLQSCNRRDVAGKQRTLILASDLLACGSASQPKGFERKLQLFTVKDWSQQLLQLMDQAEEQNSGRIDWCLVSNGGWMRAIETGALYLEKGNTSNVSNMVLSATPRLPSLLREPPSPEKVQKSYRFLSGVAGKLCWWYSFLRNNGKLIRKFSERILTADPANFGEDWTLQYVATANILNSKYSTFGFHDCRPVFHALRDRIEIDVIRTRPKKGSNSAQVDSGIASEI